MVFISHHLHLALVLPELVNVFGSMGLSVLDSIAVLSNACP